MLFFIPMALIYALGICLYNKETNKRWNEFVETGLTDSKYGCTCEVEDEDDDDTAVFNDCD
jgi:hypothetical protein